MKKDKEPVKDTAEANESSDFDDVCDIASSSSPSKRILSSSLSSLEDKQTGVDDSDNNSGFVGDSRISIDRLSTTTSDVNNEINGCPRTNGVYDREAILYDLANSGDSDISRMLEKIEEKQKAEKISSKSSKNFIDECEDAQIPDKECQKSLVERLRKALEAIPDSMLHLITGRHRPGDCGRPSDQKPDWLDMDKLRRGQKFAQDHMFQVFFVQLLSLFALYSFEDGLKAIIITGNSSAPYKAFKRYLSTSLRVRHWYTEDPWAKGTSARKDILTVRVMHAAIRRKLDASTNEEIDAAALIPNAWCPTREMLIKDFSESCQAPAIGQCPYHAERNSPDRFKGNNQLEMALTQWVFIGLIVCYPKYLGFHSATDEDFEAFCHLWRSLGYQLGMEDEYNFCRGSLEEIRQRSRDFVETWFKPNLREITPEWEHTMRCICTGVSMFFPGMTYEGFILHLAEILDLKMPRLHASLSYKNWISYNFIKSLFYYTIRLPGMSGLMNNLLNYSLDRAEKFTPEELEAIRIKLTNHPANNMQPNENLVSASS